MSFALPFTSGTFELAGEANRTRSADSSASI